MQYSKTIIITLFIDLGRIQHVRIPCQAKVDGTLDFACPPSPVNYQKDPVRTIETNFCAVTRWRTCVR